MEIVIYFWRGRPYKQFLAQLSRLSIRLSDRNTVANYVETVEPNEFVDDIYIDLIYFLHILDSVCGVKNPA